MVILIIYSSRTHPKKQAAARSRRRPERARSARALAADAALLEPLLAALPAEALGLLRGIQTQYNRLAGDAQAEASRQVTLKDAVLENVQRGAEPSQKTR